VDPEECWYLSAKVQIVMSQKLVSIIFCCANLFIFDVMHRIVLRSDYAIEWSSNTTMVFILCCNWSAIGYMFRPSCGHLQAVCF